MDNLENINDDELFLEDESTKTGTTKKSYKLIMAVIALIALILIIITLIIILATRKSKDNNVESNENGENSKSYESSEDIKEKVKQNVTFKYLEEIKKKSQSSSIKKIIYILGNSGVDMDSAMSAYIMSMAKNIEIGTIKYENKKTSIIDNPTEIALPILNLIPSEFVSRLDIIYLLEKLGISQNDFLFINDTQLTEESLEKKIKDGFKIEFILVDFSELSTSQNYLAKYITYIYDHHIPNVFNYPNLSGINIKYIVGSSATLILQDYFLKNYPEDCLHIEIALATTLLDTDNFKSSKYKNRWIDLDKDVFDTLLKNTNFDIDTDNLYETLKNEQKDEDKNLALGYKLLFSKDRKEYRWNTTTAIWSSFQIKYKKIIKKFKSKVLKKYISEYKTNFKYYICSSKYDSSSKECNIYILDDSNIDTTSLKNYFDKSDCSSKIQNISYYENLRKIYILFDDSFSRKIIEPYFRKFFSY